MKRIVTVVLGLIFMFAVVPFLLMLARPAHAQQITYDSPCGVEATGKRPDNNQIVTYRAGNQHVSAAGYWELCSETHNSDVPPPKRDCLPLGGYTWEVDGNQCTTMWSGQGAGVKLLKHAESTVLIQDAGPNRGSVGLRCLDGRLQEIGATCAPAVTCPNRVEIRYGSGESCTIKVDVRGPAPPLGARLALPADAKPGWSGSGVLQCAYGGWQWADAPTCVQK